MSISFLNHKMSKNQFYKLLDFHSVTQPEKLSDDVLPIK